MSLSFYATRQTQRINEAFQLLRPGSRHSRGAMTSEQDCGHTSCYNPEIEARHFAHHCPGAPEAVKQAARASFVRH